MEALRVVQLRHVPGNPSMTRFAQGLAAALPSDGALAVEQFSPRFRRRTGSRHQLTRLLRYPLAASRLRADVFHLLDHGLGHLTLVLPGERTVVTCHDLAPLRAARSDPRFRTGVATVARYRLIARLLRRVGAVVCASEATRAEVCTLTEVDPMRVEVIAPGISPAFRPATEAERREARERIPLRTASLLIHVSTTRYPYKNVPGVLGALAALRNGGVDAGLIRVGRPLYRHERRLARRLRVAKVVHEVGAVDDDELARLYGVADALLFPSYHEGFGWPPLEAMACGTPAVVSDCAALRETLGEAALRAGADDAEGLARRLAGILSSDQLARRLRERGLARASAYTWERTADRYRAIYRRLAASAV